MVHPVTVVALKETVPVPHRELLLAEVGGLGIAFTVSTHCPLLCVKVLQELFFAQRVKVWAPVVVIYAVGV
jgi:hypothetical protein